MQRVLAAALVIVGGCASGHTPGTPTTASVRWDQYVSECPLTPGKLGYPLVASAVGVHETTLTRIARAVGYGWPRQGPDSSRPEDIKVNALRFRATPHDALHRNGWTPHLGDTATLHLVYRRDERPRVVSSSSALPFYRRAVRAAERAIGFAVAEDSPTTLPLSLDGATDSVVVQLRFGAEPQPGEGVARFALMERPPRPKTRPNVRYPEAMRERNVEGSARLGLVIGTDGTVDPASILVLSATHREFADAGIEFLRSAAFEPFVVDCQPIAEIEIQPFYFNLTMSAQKVPFKIRP